MVFVKGHPQYNTGRTWFKKGHHLNKGRRLSPGHILKISKANKGNKPWNTGKSGLRLNPKTEFKKGSIPWNKGLKGRQPFHNIEGLKKGWGFWKGKKRPKVSGARHWNWKGGVSGLTQKNRAYFYETTRPEVLERDNYRCQICGGQENLEVDHIKKWAENPGLRFSKDNCRALCLGCHKKTKTYGIGRW